MTNLECFFTPRSVAIFGASTNPLKSGYKLFENLARNSIAKLYPINPHGGEIFGIHVYTSLKEVPDSIDLAVIFVPNEMVIGILQECITKGIQGAIIEAAGFEEVGEEGLQIRNQIAQITDNFTKIRIVGPNCTGITYIGENGDGLYTSFVPMPKIKPGSFALISQSGFTNGGYFLDVATHYPSLGFRYVCAIGNKMDLSENEFLAHMIKDPKVSTIGIYVESFRNVREFIHLCREGINHYKKKIILLRSGTSEYGAKAAKSHTGALAEKEELIKAVVRQSYCIPADDFYDFFAIGRVLEFAFQNQLSWPSDPNIAILTISGGAGAVLSDLCSKYELNIPDLSESAYTSLKALYPPWMSPNRFAVLDIWPAVEQAKGNLQAVMYQCIEIALKDPGVKVLLLTSFYTQDSWKIDWLALKSLIEKYKKPIFVWLFGKYQDVLTAEDIFQQIQIPVFFVEHEMVSICAKIITAQRRSKVSHE
jgi:acyl-CoA synthetase (NDP forming)